jgi:hypothetical protein
VILGRPTNLWLGLVTLLSGAIVATAITVGYDPATVGTLGSVWSGVLGGVILLVANQPPTVNEGDDIKIVTPPGQENATIQATIPPLEPAG